MPDDSIMRIKATHVDGYRFATLYLGSETIILSEVELRKLRSQVNRVIQKMGDERKGRK